MNETDSAIRAECPLYACKECRTKTGWRHQRWCGMADKTEPGCAECRYFNAGKNACAHPARRKGGAARHEKIQYSL